MGKPIYSQEESDDRVRRALAAERRRQPSTFNAEVARVDPLPVLNTQTLLTVPGLLEHFTVVSPDFYSNEHGTAVIACPCGWTDPDDADFRTHRVEPGGLLECPGCLRIYFMGEQLRAAPAGDAPGYEHCHPPEVPCVAPCPEAIA